MIHTENLTKKFGNVVAVENLNLDIKEGEVFGFLGSKWCRKNNYCQDACKPHRPDQRQRKGRRVHGRRAGHRYTQECWATNRDSWNVR